MYWNILYAAGTEDSLTEWVFCQCGSSLTISSKTFGFSVASTDNNSYHNEMSKLFCGGNWMFSRQKCHFTCRQISYYFLIALVTDCSMMYVRLSVYHCTGGKPLKQVILGIFMCWGGENWLSSALVIGAASFVI